ncbi:MAG: fimbrial protein FimH [Proteobacteria bacterium]|nr:MAG: fimbrial protein FimH [Pseudomonadota bacterium]
MRLRNILLTGLLLLVSATGHAQTCNDRMRATTPDSRFELSGDEVKDLQTGLVWQRCSVGQQWDGTTCTGSATTHTWPAALALATGNWRLPNIKELASIVETACHSPAINLAMFPNTASGSYWSSSPDVGYSYNAWYVYFYYGEDGTVSKHYDLYVRLVRGGQ